MADAWTLAELSKIETDTLRKSVTDTLLMESNLMQLIPWETIGQLATTIVRVQDLPSVGFRKINEGYAAAVGHFEQKVENIALMGCYLDCDKAIARAKNTIADARAIAQVMALKAMAYKFNDKFINGDPTVTVAGHFTQEDEFRGLALRVDEVVAEGYTEQKIDNAGTYGAARDAGILYATADSHNFLNKIDQLIYSIKGHSPDFLLMNKKMLLCLRAVLRKEKLLDNTRDMFDRVVDVYQGCRLVDIGVKADQITEIILNTEDPDSLYTATDPVSTSIYAVKFGIGELLWGIQEYPLEVEDKGLLEAKPVYRTEVDWPLGLALADPRAVGRLYNVFPDSTVQS